MPAPPVRQRRVKLFRPSSRVRPFTRADLVPKSTLLINGNEQPQRVILTPGQAGDAPQVPHLFDQLSPNFGILDKAYDTDNVLEYFESHDITPVIPPKVNRVVQREYDKEHL